MAGPSPAEVIRDDRLFRDALAVRRERLLRAGLKPGDPEELRGLTTRELAERFDTLASENSRRTVLLLLAAVEMVVREDYLRRVGSRTGGRGLKDPLSKQLANLARRYEKPNNVGLRPLLKIWRDRTEAGPDGPINRFLQLVRHRNWLAHGRVGVDPSGIRDVSVEFAAVQSRALLERLDAYDRSFTDTAASLGDV